MQRLFGNEVDGGFEIPSDRNKQPLVWLDYKLMLMVLC